MASNNHDEEWEIVSMDVLLINEYDMASEASLSSELLEEANLCFMLDQPKVLPYLSHNSQGSSEESSKDERDKLLEDVFYALIIAHKSSKGRQEDVAITKHLQQVFQVTDEEVRQIMDKARCRKVPEIKIKVKISKVTKNGLAKANNDNSSYYFKAYLDPTTPDDCQIPTKNATFELKSTSTDNGFLTIDVMKKPNLKMKILLNSQSRSRENECDLKFLGHIKIPLQELRNSSMDKMFELRNLDETTPQKTRRFQIRAHLDFFQCQNEFDALLDKVVRYNVKIEDMNTTHRWNGQLDANSQDMIKHYLYAFSVDKSEEDLYWWTNCMELPFTDNTWLLKLIMRVFKHFNKGLYTNEQKNILRNSLDRWHILCLEKLKNLFTYFPILTKNDSLSQLESMLRIANVAEGFHFEEPSTNITLTLKEQVEEAALTSVMIWWNDAMSRIVELSTLEDKMKGAKEFTSELNKLLSTEIAHYDAAFRSELDCNFLKEARRILHEKVKIYVEPLVKNVNRSYNSSGQALTSEDIGFQVSDDMWELFVIVRDIHRTRNITSHVESHYESWFLQFVNYWLESARRRACSRIRRAIQLDAMKKIDDNEFKSTSSALDTSCIVSMILVWWQELKWSDDAYYGLFLVEAINNVCFCSLVYANHLIDKVSGMSMSKSSHDFEFVTSNMVCYAINNMEKVRTQVLALRQKTEIHKFLMKLKRSSGEATSSTIETNTQNILENFDIEMKTKIKQLTISAFDKVRGIIIKRFLNCAKSTRANRACRSLFLQWISASKERICPHQAQEFLQNMMEGFVGILEWTVHNEEPGGKEFRKILSILEVGIRTTSLQLDLKPEVFEGEIEGYSELKETLKIHTLPTKMIIEKYYWERCEEQRTHQCKQSPELVAIVFYNSMSGLNVEILMGKNLTHNRHSTGCSGIYPKAESNDQKLINSYVNVELVPLSLFDDYARKKTKTVYETDPVVYQEEFSFGISGDDHRTENGFIQFTLKQWKNVTLGQAFIPLKEIGIMEEASQAAPRHLKMTYPQPFSGYKSLSVLMKRKKDHSAQIFLNKIKNTKYL